MISEPFLAEIKIVGFNFAPRGWAFCDGQILPINQNQSLYSLLGTTYGGDGRTTTALPNLQGRAPMHPGRGPGLTARKLGARVGVDTVTLSEAQIPSHTHTLRAATALATAAEAPTNTSSLSRATAVAYQTDTSASSLVDMASATLSTTGGGQPHANMQPYLTLNFIIALVGVYPSRS